ncbi:MAG TPA: MFS transporter [Dongiaceae bacterium]
MGRGSSDSISEWIARSWWITGVVGFALFLDYFVYGAFAPLTLYSPVKLADEAQFGLLYAAYSIGLLVATPVFGYLGVRIGLKRSMICGVALLAAGVLLFWFAADFAMLFLARLLEGSAAAATWTAGLSLIATYHVKRRVEMMGYAMVASTAGSILGPAAGGLLDQLGGYSLPLALMTALIVIDAVLRLAVLPADKPEGQSTLPLGDLLRDMAVLVPAAAVALAAVGWSITEPLVPAELGQDGLSAAGIGLVVTLSTIAYGLSAPLVSWVSMRAPIRKVIAGGTLAMALALPSRSLLHGMIGVTIGLCLVSVAYAFMLNPTTAELGNAVDRRGLTCYSAVYAIYNIAYSLGMMSTDAFASATASSLGFLPTLLCVGAVLILAVPFLLRTAPTPAASSQPSQS